MLEFQLSIFSDVSRRFKNPKKGIYEFSLVLQQKLLEYRTYQTKKKYNYLVEKKINIRKN